MTHGELLTVFYVKKGLIMKGSIWKTSLPGYSSPDDNILADAIVIGGGMCGLLTAYLLGKRGVDTVLLEADRLFSGQSGRTTAKLTAQHGLIYSELIKSFGREKAREYALANLSAIKTYADIISEHSIDCDMRECDSYIYSRSEGERLRREADACKRLGIDCEFTKDTELPFDVDGAVRFGSQACFDPLAFACGLLRNMPDCVRIYENTMVTEVKESICTLRRRGEHETEPHELTAVAKNIIFCTHFPFVNTHGLYFARMHGEMSYVAALENAPEYDGLYLGIAPEKGETDELSSLSFRSCRQDGKSYLLLGGMGHRTGKNPDGERYKRLRAAARRLYPDADVVTEWAAQDCMTLDNIPYIGVYSSSSPEGWYTATGFCKWGMTSSMVAAKMLTSKVTGEEQTMSVFDSVRVSLKDVGESVKESMTAVGGLVKQNLVLPRAAVDSVPIGSGKRVEIDGESVGVYRETAELYHVVSVKCPHLGCALEWNDDEKTWDCPCHGSRFDFDGKLLDNPAMRDI